MTKVYLRLMTNDEMPTFFGWLDKEKETLLPMYSVSPGNPQVVLGIVESNSHRLVGAIKVDVFTKEVGIVIGEESERGKGYGTEAINLVCGMAFTYLHATQLVARIHFLNTRSILAFTAAGFIYKGSMGKEDIYVRVR